MRGKFIVMEGVDGSGKTSQIPKIVDYLKAEGIETVVTKQPGGSDFGLEVRKLFVQFDGTLNPLSQLFLMVADRIENISRVITPALQAGKWVLCDRYHMSSVVYQGHMGTLPDDLMETFSGLIEKNLMPDLTLVLDVEAEVSLSRMEKRKENLKEGAFFDSEKESFYRSVIDFYREEAAKSNYPLIDANGGVEETFVRITEVLNSRFFAEK